MVRESAQGGKYIVKNVLQGDFEYQQELQKPLLALPTLRTMVDTIPDWELLVHHFLTSDLLCFAQKPLSDGLKRDILRSALIGLAELHGKNVIHPGEYSVGGIEPAPGRRRSLTVI
jgi:hypothetical protein